MDVSNLWDIHSHILPGIDDGARSMEASLQMASDAVKNGVSHVVCTPHFYYSQESNEVIKTANAKHAAFTEALRQSEIPLETSLGFEVYASEALLYADNLEDLLIKNTNCLLLELDFENQPDYFDELFYVFSTKGIQVILAHPERYWYFRRNLSLLSKLCDTGVRLQVNAGSILGHFGYGACFFVKKLLRRGMVSFIASDAHSPDKRSFCNREAARKAQGFLSPQELERLLSAALPLPVL